MNITMITMTNLFKYIIHRNNKLWQNKCGGKLLGLLNQYYY